MYVCMYTHVCTVLTYRWIAARQSPHILEKKVSIEWKIHTNPCQPSEQQVENKNAGETSRTKLQARVRQNARPSHKHCSAKHANALRTHVRFSLIGILKPTRTGFHNTCRRTSLKQQVREISRTKVTSCNERTGQNASFTKKNRTRTVTRFV